jgi:hypothetical protein
MGCNRCRRDPMFDPRFDPMFDHDRFDDRDRHMRHRRRRDFFTTDEFRRRRRGRAVIIGFPRFF